MNEFVFTSRSLQERQAAIFWQLSGEARVLQVSRAVELAEVPARGMEKTMLNCSVDADQGPQDTT